MYTSWPGKERRLEQGMAKCGPWDKSGPLLVFINKVLLGHSHTYLFMYYFIVFGSFQATRAELSSCDRNHMAQKAKNIYYWAF